MIYFADKTLIFTDKAPLGNNWTIIAANAGEVSRTKIVKILETRNSVAVVCSEPEAAFAAFATEFTLVTAAGGVVLNDRGEWLMIYRNGRWDLPKGHLEAGERLDECAAREIAEETGVEARIVRQLCETYHAYYFPKTARWELKRTHWFLLRAVAAGDLCPQTEEGIERVEWCAPLKVEANLRGTFPTIRRVAEAMKSEKSE